MCSEIGRSAYELKGHVEFFLASDNPLFQTPSKIFSWC